MTEWFYPTAFQSWGEEERAAIDRVLRSGRFTMGDEVRAFEEEFAAFHGMKHAVMVNSGSSANLLMIAALFNKAENPLRRGDVAVVPARAWTRPPGVHWWPLVARVHRAPATAPGSPEPHGGPCQRLSSRPPTDEARTRSQPRPAASPGPAAG